jgi:hypothetical protein
MSEAQLKKAVARIDATLKEVEGVKADARAWLEKRAQDDKYLQRARSLLIGSGLSAERAKEFPALQVVLLNEKRAYEELRDEGLKWMSLPYWQAEAGILVELTPGRREDCLFGKLLLPHIKVKNAQARFEQRIGLLRHVEAIRLYAADHDGKVDGQDAVLRGSPPRGMEASPVHNLRFVVTIKK